MSDKIEQLLTSEGIPRFGQKPVRFWSRLHGLGPSILPSENNSRSMELGISETAQDPQVVHPVVIFQEASKENI